MGVQCQQERWTFLHDAHPCMPVPVDASLVSFGFPETNAPNARLSWRPGRVSPTKSPAAKLAITPATWR